MASKAGRTFVIDYYKKQLQQEAKKRMAKKGLLTKIVESKKKRANVLVNILQESNNFNTLNNDSFKNATEANSEKKPPSDEEFLKKYYQAGKGGPKHSIAVSRAHHLTNFLTEYILNAFASGQFETPDIAAYKKSNPEFAEDYVFEISQIELLADLTALKIYWLNSGNEKLDAYIESFVNSKMQAHIRQTLSDERVMSYVPRVVFVRDQTDSLMKKLDEHLAQVRFETSQSNENADSVNQNTTQTDTDSLVTVKPSQKPSVTKKAIDNLYGVEFNRLIEKIKKNNPSDCSLYSPKSEETSLEVVKKEEPVSLEARSKFERSLKAFQINKRIDHQRVNKSAILKLSMLEMERKKIDEELDRLNND
jgi:ribosome-binding factor A